MRTELDISIFLLLMLSWMDRL